MNRTKIDWATHVWNPLSGCYGPSGTAEQPKRCFYCYAHRMAHRLRGRAGYPTDDPFRPTFHPDRLLEPSRIKKPARIFVGSMGEMFAPYVPDAWVRTVMAAVNSCPHHTFIFLTKNPAELQRWSPWPSNAWVGASATDYTMANKARWAMRDIKASVRFLSLEPLLSPIEDKNGAPFRFELGSYNWAIIGAATGPGAEKLKPQLEWVMDLVDGADKVGVPVFMKNNLRRHFPDLVLRQELPHA